MYATAIMWHFFFGWEKQSMNQRVFIVAAVGACLWSTGVLHAQVRSFDGGGDGTSWADPTNWSDNDTPDTGGESASIDAGGAWGVSSSGAALSVGSLTIGSDDKLTVSNQLGLGGITSLSGELVINAGANMTVNSSWQNDGIITLNEFGLLGTPSSAHSVTNNETGLIRGQLHIAPLGFITNTLINHGTISPGFGPNDGKSLSITADVTLTSTSVLDIEIGGGTTNNGFDTIGGLGTVTLGGELKLTQFNGYTPSPSGAFVIVDSIFSNGITGSFSNVADGERLFTTDGSGSWLVQYGTSHAHSDVVITDYRPVPEPGTSALLGMLGAVLLSRHRNRATS